MSREMAFIVVFPCVLFGVGMGVALATRPPTTASPPTVSVPSTPITNHVWHQTSEDQTYVVIYTRTATNVTRCYLMNRAGGQPIQIECPAPK